MSIVLDCMVVIFLLYFLFDGYRKKISISFFEILGTLIALVIAIFLAPYVTNFFYDIFMKDFLISKIELSLTQNASLDPTQKVFSVLNSIPNFIANSIDSYDVRVDQLTAAVSSATPIDNLITLFKPVTLNVLLAPILYIIFTILFFIFKGVFRLINRYVTLPVLPTVDKILGALLGLTKGIIILLLVTEVIEFILKGYFQAPEFINTDIINKSVLFSKLYYIDFKFINRMA